jgi:hypothetical protein
MATIVKTEKYQRGTFGTFIKWAFIAFNVIMLLWIVSGFSAVSNIEVHSTAESAGRAIGSAIGFASLLTLWVFGDIILGVLVLFTRGQKIIVEETSGGSSYSSVTASEGNFSKADELIAQLKAQRSATDNSPPSRYTPSVGSSPSFGKRR